MTKINPNPHCLTCTHHQWVHIDAYGGLVGTHNMYIRQIESKPIGDLVPLALYQNDEECIDDFLQGDGECPYYVEDSMTAQCVKDTQEQFNIGLKHLEAYILGNLDALRRWKHIVLINILIEKNFCDSRKMHFYNCLEQLLRAHEEDKDDFNC